MSIDEAKQLMQTFQHMVPVMAQWRPNLSEGNAPKRSRQNGAPEEAEGSQIIVFFSSDPQGALPKLIQETLNWRKTVEDKTCQLPLRCHLVKTFLQAVQDRVHQVAQAAPTAEIRQVAIKKSLLTSDGCWPYHRWDPVKQSLIYQKTALKFDNVKQLIDELVESATQEDLVLQFHSMRGDKLSTHQIIPWRLQISLRQQDPFLNLCKLCQNQVWQTACASLKLHSQKASPAAIHLQQLTGKGRGKSLSKSKGSKKGH